jgi:hypothetical protein
LMARAWNVLTASRANANAALTFMSVTRSTSSSVICRKGFHTAKPASKSATRMSEFSASVTAPRGT